MADSAFSKLLDGPFFTFTVGLEGENTKDIIMHCAPIAIHSKPLSALMDGKMQEAQERKARIKVDIATFERFCEYVYFRGYTDPVPEPWPEPDEVPGGENDEQSTTTDDNYDNYAPGGNEIPPDINDNDFRSRLLRHKKTKHKKSISEEEPPKPVVAGSKQIVQEEFQEKQFSTTDSSFDIYPMLQWNSNVDTAAADFTVVLKDHGKLYVFSDQYQINGLKNLVLYKLHCTLKQFELTSSNIGAILDLADYLFENTPPVPGEPARDLIVHYVAAHIDDFMFSQPFSDRIIKGGDFTHMVMVKIYEVLN